MLKFAAAVAVAGMLFMVAAPTRSQAQVVTTYHAPAPSVGVVPVRRGLLGLRRGYIPVVVGSVPVAVTTSYAPARVTSYYAGPGDGYYAPARVTSYYVPAPVTTVLCTSAGNDVLRATVIIGD